MGATVALSTYFASQSLNHSDSFSPSKPVQRVNQVFRANENRYWRFFVVSPRQWASSIEAGNFPILLR